VRARVHMRACMHACMFCECMHACMFCECVPCATLEGHRGGGGAEREDDAASGAQSSRSSA
jgi:hypothetical protein